MKTRYFLLHQGYYGGPSFATLAEARIALREAAAASLAECKARYGKAICVSFEDSREILIGHRQSVSRWAHFGIAAV
jgi:hypothetical protein